MWLILHLGSHFSNHCRNTDSEVIQILIQILVIETRFFLSSKESKSPSVVFSPISVWYSQEEKEQYTCRGCNSSVQNTHHNYGTKVYMYKSSKKISSWKPKRKNFRHSLNEVSKLSALLFTRSRTTEKIWGTVSGLSHTYSTKSTASLVY